MLLATFVTADKSSSRRGAKLSLRRCRWCGARVGAGALVVFGDYQIAPIAARSTAMGRWRLTPPGYWGDTACGRDRGNTSSVSLRLPPSPQGEGLRGASFNGAKPSRGRLTSAGTPHPSASLPPVSLRVGRFAGLTGHRPVIQYREPLKGKAWGIKRSARGRFF